VNSLNHHFLVTGRSLTTIWGTGWQILPTARPEGGVVGRAAARGRRVLPRRHPPVVPESVGLAAIGRV